MPRDAIIGCRNPLFSCIYTRSSNFQAAAGSFARSFPLYSQTFSTLLQRKTMGVRGLHARTAMAGLLTQLRWKRHS